MAQAVVRLTKRQITTADEPSIAELRAELAGVKLVRTAPEHETVVPFQSLEKRAHVHIRPEDIGPGIGDKFLSKVASVSPSAGRHIYATNPRSS